MARCGIAPCGPWRSMKSTPRGSDESIDESMRRRDEEAAERRIVAGIFKAFWLEYMDMAMRRSRQAAAAIPCMCAGKASGPGARPPIPAVACPAPQRRSMAPPARRPANWPPLSRSPCAQSRVRGASTGPGPAASTRDVGPVQRRPPAAAAAADTTEGRRGHVTSWPTRSGPPPALCGPRYVAAGRGAARAEGRPRAPAAIRGLRPVAGGRPAASAPEPPASFSRLWAAASAPTRGRIPWTGRRQVGLRAALS